MSPTSPAPRLSDRLPVGLKLGWSIGAVGAVTMLSTVNVLLMYFMVNYLGIDPALAGTVVFATRLYDIVFDPLMGWVSDRYETRWGRRRPWMALAALISAVTCAAVFRPPGLDPAQALPLYMFVALLLFFSGYTMFFIPFMAMPAEMTSDPDERTSIMSYRTFSSGAGGMIATAAAPALVAYLGRTREAYATTGLIIAAIIGVTMLISSIASRGARHTTRTAVRYPFRVWLASVFANRPMMALIATKFLVYSAISLIAGLNLFYMTSVLARGERGQALYGLIMNGTTALILPLLVRIVRGRPKPVMLRVAIIVYMIATLSWLLAWPGEPNVLFLLRCFGVGIGYASIVLMVLSMLPDVIQHDFDRTGLRREGVLSALFAFVEKVAYATTPLITGILLKLTGYVQGEGGALAQPPNAILGLRLAVSVLPCLMCLVGLIFLRAYRLDLRPRAAGQAS